MKNTKTVRDIMDIPMISHIPIGLKLRNSKTVVYFYYKEFWINHFPDYLDCKVREFKVSYNDVRWSCLITYEIEE